VGEIDGVLAGVVQYGRIGGDRRRWDIGTVATAHPFRRQGVARRLVTAAVEDVVRRGGAQITLKVREDNAAAYGLYRKLGFVHYTSSTSLCLDAAPSIEPIDPAPFVERPLRLSDWRNRWRLARRATPDAVQAFAPITPDQFKRSAAIRLLAPLVLRLSKMAVGAWQFADGDGRTVATLRVLARRVPKMTHDLRLVIAPAHESALAEPLLSKGLAFLRDYPRLAVETEVNGWASSRLPLLEQYGFRRLESWHGLGLRLDNGMQQNPAH
jgi:predicted GNAT family N-acyltransferase